MNKKAIAILGGIFILIIGTLGILIYSRSSSTQNPDTEQSVVENNTENSSQNTEPNPTTTPVTTQDKIHKLTDDQVISPVLTFEGDGVAYFTKQGLLYRASFVGGSNPLQIGEKKQLAIEQKTNLNKVIWPPNTQDFMLEYLNGAKKTYEFYNNEQGKFSLLPQEVYSLSYLPTGNKIYYVWSSQNGNDTVNVSDPNTENYKTLGEIWDKNAMVYVSPDGMNVAYYKDPATVSGAVNPLVLTDTEGKTWKKISGGFVKGILWSPDGKKLLFSKQDPSTQKFQLWIYDLYTEDVRNLGLDTTPDKAVWALDNQTIYAAVPFTQTAQNSGLTLDTFYKLSLQTLQATQYQSGDKQIDGEDLFLNHTQNNPTADKLFFRNGQDGGLYYLDLNQ
ncbi:MAG: PD40 domain-containing protein [Candidatus Doudnabacteria bacterium]|nr:PD40 domain-containing protein [Candidatus Doudnabacteria bacterium]